MTQKSVRERLGSDICEPANALEAAQMPKQLSDSTRHFDISVESTNSVDYSSLIPLRDRLVGPDVPASSPSHRRSRSMLFTSCLVGGDFGRRHQRGHSLPAVFASRYLARQGAVASADINNARRAGDSATDCPVVAREFGRTYTTRPDDLRTDRGRGHHYHGPVAWNGVVKRH